jgi:transcriptional regulator with XRE-family HTH domain
MKEVLLQQIGQRIREVRLEAGVLQGAIAKEFGCGQTRISAIEHGTRDPGVDFLVWFAKRTGVSTDYILLGRDEEEPKGIIIENISEFVVKRASSILKAIAMTEDFAEEIERTIKNQFPVKAPGCYWLTGEEQEVIDFLRKHTDAEKSFFDYVSRESEMQTEE